MNGHYFKANTEDISDRFCSECGRYMTDYIHFQTKTNCGRMCGNQDPYGFVPEAGCHIHDSESPVMHDEPQNDVQGAAGGFTQVACEH